MTIHIGILGGGNISRTHARAASSIAGVEISAVCGPNRAKVETLASDFGCPAYYDVEAFLSHTPMDLVLIGSPSGLHGEHGKAAARHGLHVLVEKPIEITVQRADSLIETCEKCGVKLGVFFQDRCAPDIARLKLLIDSGGLGQPILMSAAVKWYRPGSYYGDSKWRGTTQLDGGGALINQGIHTVDLLLWLSGDVTRTWAVSKTAHHRIEVEDTIVAVFEFANGAIGTLEASTAVYPGFPRRIEMTWTGGTIAIANDRIISVNLRSSPSGFERYEAIESERSVSPVVEDFSGHREIIRDFIGVIENDRSPLCSGREGRRSVEFVEAIYESARTGQPVSPGEARRNPANHKIGGAKQHR